MKKRVLCVACVLLFGLAAALGCGGSGTGTDGPGTDVYNTVSDYSGIQGYRNWYYLTARDALSEAEYMIWDAEMCTWRMSDINCLIEPHIVHPGQLDQVIRAWKAPADGRVVFHSKLQRRPVNRNGIGQDGCYIYVATGDEDDDILAEQTFGALDLELHDIDGELDVKQGEMIYFVLNCSGNYTFDQTYWEITVEHTHG